MALSLEELTKVVSKDEELTTLLELATFAGFPATSWQSGAVPRTLLELSADRGSKLSELVAAIAKGGFLDRAEGDWLTLLAKSVFDETRLAAVKTRGKVVLTCAPAAGPYTISIGQLVASDASGKRFANIDGGTLAAGGTLTLTFEAETGGGAWNIAALTLTILLTPLAGVTINNPIDITLGTWITTTGADEETDAQLRVRCRAKWSSLGTGATADTFRFWALTASAEVKRVSVREHDYAGSSIDGFVTLYLAGDGGPVSAQAVADVAAYIAVRRPLCTTVLVFSATALNIVVAATLTVQAASLATAQGELPGYITEFARSLDVASTVYRAALVEQLMRPQGMINAVLTSPAADVVLAFNAVATFTLSLTWVSQ
jgi:phage-related baseplate assembly protein